eukprot:507652-Rhodomonas_salina.2
MDTQSSIPRRCQSSHYHSHSHSHRFLAARLCRACGVLGQRRWRAACPAMAPGHAASPASAGARPFRSGIAAILCGEHIESDRETVNRVTTNEP